MASSFVVHQEKGFWVKDGRLEIWLYLLAQEINKLAEVPPWLAQLREGWEFQTTGTCSGFMTAYLDEFAIDDQRRRVLLELSECALQRLDEYGDYITAEQLRATKVGGGGYMCDLPTEGFKRVGQTFIKLLRGEVDTDASTSPML